MSVVIQHTQFIHPAATDDGIAKHTSDNLAAAISDARYAGLKQFRLADGTLYSRKWNGGYDSANNSPLTLPPPDRMKTPTRLIGSEHISLPAKWKIWSFLWSGTGLFCAIGQYMGNIR